MLVENHGRGSVVGDRCWLACKTTPGEHGTMATELLVVRVGATSRVATLGEV